MSSALEDCCLREIFTSGEWILRKVSDSQPTKYATVSERNYCWRELARDKKQKDKHAFGLSKPISEQHITETSKIMKRDIKGKLCPWISTTHKDFYGQCYSKVTDRRIKVKSPVKESKPENMHRLVSSVSHVPIIRMNCYGDNHFDTRYTHEFTHLGPSTRDSVLQKDYDFSRKIENPAAPYSSKKWITSYKFDYGLLPKIKSSEVVSSDIKEVHISKEPLYQPDWTTSNQDYGQITGKYFIKTVPCPNIFESITDLKQSNTEPTAAVGRLMIY